jgi:enoyl-CoA hydratase/carnithine racemase
MFFVNTASDILVDARESGLVRITVNRPHKHNALARSVLAELADAVRSSGNDPTTRCVIVCGAGDKYFAAGGDLVDLAQVKTDAATRQMADEATTALDAVRECPVPVIAYVNGDALGGGAELAVACDLRMIESSARIGFVQGRLAITSAWGGGTDLCQLVGSARATRMMSRCEMIGAETALAWGLVDVIVSGGPESADVAAFLKPLLDRSPLVLRGIKAQTRAWRNGLAFESRRAIERDNLVATWLSDEHWAAVERFLAKEKP